MLRYRAPLVRYFQRRGLTLRRWGRLCSLGSVAAFALFAWFALTLNLFTATTMF